MAGFTKLFADIVHSTVWREDVHTKIVWITMLAMSDRHGQVMSSLPGLADSAKVTLNQCIHALSILSAPDQYSRTKEYEGRRISDIDGGWLLLNYEKYRARKDDEEQRLRTMDRVRRHRARLVTESVTATAGHPIAEAEAEAKNKTTLSGLPPDVGQPERKNGNPSLTKQAIEVLEFLNATTGRNYRATDSTDKPTTSLQHIISRLKTGATVQDCKTLIARKHRDWAGNDKMWPYLRPATLFNATKFEQYLGECVIDDPQKRRVDEL